MSTLTELIHYCNEADPIGALMLTGEWGCGKTYLIENDLADALKDTHIIVRVSLFGMTEPKQLQDTVRQRWFEACLPVLGSLQKARNNSGGILRAINQAIKAINPLAGTAADVMVSMNALDVFPIQSEIEDLMTRGKKRVILVYDDLERVKMDPLELLGVINDYCENQGFNTIISANEEFFRKEMDTADATYHMLREKTVSQSLYHIPDFAGIIHSIISEREWPSPEYAEYLAEREDLVLDVFVSEEEEARPLLSRENGKYHNFRSLTKGMESFYRLYYHMNQEGIEIPDSCLYSFLAYFLTAKSGIHKDGKLTLEFDDSDIMRLYPEYSPDMMTEAERVWIESGLWNRDKYLKELTAIHGAAGLP